MNKDILKNILLILLLGLTGFSMFKYVSELMEKYRLKDSLIQAQDQITALVQERQNLLQNIEKEKELKEQLALKSTNLKSYLKASKNRITRLLHDNAVTKDNLEEAKARFSILKAENKALIDGRKRLYAENEQFKLKLNSVTELKKIIRDLRNKKHNDPIIGTEGNRGFLIKDGQSTAVERVKIEVIPAQTKE
jgi:hypothetical protein